jgi:N-acetylmuramic acid 6-phosphate (MurNAc-6-P) etherase
MQNYRTYFLDQDGHISNAIDMACTDDEQAKECAKKFLSDRNAELWKEDRLIAIYTSGKGPFQASGDQQASGLRK